LNILGFRTLPLATPAKDPFNHVARQLIAAFRGVPDHTPARQVRRPTLSLGPLIEELLVEHRIGRVSPEDAIREQWPELAGQGNSHYSHPGLIDPKGKLTILCSHAIVRTELNFHKATVLARIKALPGCGHVKDLIIRAG